MKINQVSVSVAAILGISQALRISEHVANYTAANLDFDRGAAAIAEESPPPLPPRLVLPPPLPARPTPKPPKGPNSSLFDNASDDIWERAKCKGANFVRAMHGSDRDAGQVFKPPRDSAASEFENLDFYAAEKWGWDYSDRLIRGDFKIWGIDHVLRDLGLSDRCYGWGGSMDCITFVHGLKQGDDGDWEPDPSTYVVNDKTYRRSGAHYGIGFEPQKGFIIALDQDSPQSTGKQLDPPVEGNELPAIQASSDIMWLYWKLYGNSAGPNHFMSTCIINAETQAVASRAIRETIPDAQNFPAWGGYDFDTDTPEGQALLGESPFRIGGTFKQSKLIFPGTPNAQAFSYFLLQHKATLGNLYISQVRVFRDNKDEPIGPSLLFIVEPVPANDDKNDSTEPYEDIPSLLAKLKQRQGATDTVNIAANPPSVLPAPKPLVVESEPSEDLFSTAPVDSYLRLYPNAGREEWDKVQCKGANFVKAMRGSDNEAGKIFDPSRDTAAGIYNSEQLDEVTRWGWSGKEEHKSDIRHYGLGNVLRDMGSSDVLFADDGNLRLVSYVHGASKQDENGRWQHFEQ